MADGCTPIQTAAPNSPAKLAAGTHNFQAWPGSTRSSAINLRLVEHQYLRNDRARPEKICLDWQALLAHDPALHTHVAVDDCALWIDPGSSSTTLEEVPQFDITISVNRHRHIGPDVLGIVSRKVTSSSRGLAHAISKQCCVKECSG
jgi:hypothetical protein